MDAYENKRREFLKKLGLIAGATVLTTSGFAKAAEIISPKELEIKVTPDQEKFLSMYEKWLDEFQDMAKFQKKDPEHLGNNQKLMALSDEAAKWQKELIEHMKDDSFARRFMIMSERVTNTI